MCTNYEAITRQHELEARFKLSDLPILPGKANMRPTDRALLVAGGGRAVVLTWGIPAPWDGKPLINARAETLTKKPTFRPLLETRCLVPATAYFEWRRDGRARLKNRIAPADGQPFAFAGLHDGSHFTIVTCASAPAIAHIHPRMPVILDRMAETRWIDATLDFSEVADVLQPFTADPLHAVEDKPGPSAQADLFSTENL